MSAPLFKRLSRMLADRSHAIGDEAVRTGLITPDQLAMCEREAAAHPELPFRKILSEKVGLADQALDLLELMSNRAGGQALGARYELREEVGSGGLGVIYKGWDRQLQRNVAVKFLRADRAVDSQALRRMQNEATAVARLKHPNVLVLHDVGEQGGLPYLVLELIEGPTLAEKIGTIGIPDAVRLIEKSARAIHHCHEQGLLHRDLKPDNIKLDAHGEPKVLDFGLVHLFGGEEGLTRTGAAVGTPLYMAPEQVRADRDRIGPATDIYGLAASLYHLVTRQPPHIAETTYEVLEKVLNADIPKPRSINPAISADLETVLLHALERDPRRRYATALAFADDLARVLNDEPVSARRSTWTNRIGRRMKRHPLGWIALGVALGALALFLPKRATPPPPVEPYYELALRTLDAMRVLEDRWHGAPTPDPAAALRTIEAAVTSAPSARAWRGMALFFAGRGDEGIREIEKARADAPENPFPHLFLARVRMAEYVASTGLRAVTKFGDRLQKVQSPEMQAALRKAVEAVKPAKTPEFVAYIEGARCLEAQQFEEAERRFAGVKDAPLFKGECDILRAISLLFLERFGEAAKAAELVTPRRWVIAHQFAGFAWTMHADRLNKAKENPLPAFEAAVSHMNTLINRDGDPTGKRVRGIVLTLMGAAIPDVARRMDVLYDAIDDLREKEDEPLGEAVLKARVSCFAMLAKCEAASGKDPLSSQVAALADYRRLLALVPEAHDLRLAWATLAANTARAQAARRINPVPACDEAVAAYTVLLAGREDAGMRYDRGVAQLQAATWNSGAPDARDRCTQAEADFRRAMELNGEDFRYVGALGTALKALGRPAEALAALRRSLALNPDQPEVKSLVEKLERK